MSSEIEILTQLHEQLVEFLDQLIETFPDEGDFIIFRIFVKDKLPIADIMKYIVNKLLPLRDMVKKRDEDFFLNHNILFSQINNPDKINHFKKLWLSENVDEENKEVIWRWFDAFLYLAYKYKGLMKKKVD